MQNSGKQSEKKATEQEIKDKEKRLALLTKYILDFMFFAGIIVTATLPVSLKLIGKYLYPKVSSHYEEAVIIYFVLGVSACILLRELRKIFGTVLEENCFVRENVASLKKMGKWSFFIALVSLVRCIAYMTVTMAVIVLVFIIAGLFSRVLSYVFEQAVSYKEENDLTV